MAVLVSCQLRWAAMTVGLLASAGSMPSGDSPPPPIPHPMTMLMHAEPVRRELGLSEEQAAAVKAAVEEVELPLWRLRDLPAAERSRGADPLLRSLRTELNAALTRAQSERFDQLVLQAYGARAVFAPRVAAAIQLSSGQKERLQAILSSSIRMSDRTEVERNMLSVLGPPQRQTLVSLMGTPFDLATVRPVASRAPELEKVTAWINSTGLTLAQLRGKVVALHFYTFGCINCIRNLPHYNDWHTRFAGRDFVVLGIHRPETQGERDIDRVRQKAVEAGQKYAIAVDNDSGNWDTWANRVWPSVYLLDKQGFIRYWWYGELDWQGTGGEKWMRDRISELLAEP